MPEKGQQQDEQEEEESPHLDPEAGQKVGEYEEDGQGPHEEDAVQKPLAHGYRRGAAVAHAVIGQDLDPQRLSPRRGGGESAQKVRGQCGDEREAEGDIMPGQRSQEPEPDGIKDPGEHMQGQAQ